MPVCPSCHVASAPAATCPSCGAPLPAQTRPRTAPSRAPPKGWRRPGVPASVGVVATAHFVVGVPMCLVSLIMFPILVVFSMVGESFDGITLLAVAAVGPVLVLTGFGLLGAQRWARALTWIAYAAWTGLVVLKWAPSLPARALDLLVLLALLGVVLGPLASGLATREAHAFFAREGRET